MSRLAWVGLWAVIINFALGQEDYYNFGYNDGYNDAYDLGYGGDAGYNLGYDDGDYDKSTGESAPVQNEDQMVDLYSQNGKCCAVWGNSNYRTFDGKHLHFSGPCTYLMASVKNADGETGFDIRIENQYRHGLVDALAVILTINEQNTEKIYRLTEENVFTLNGNIQNIPYMDNIVEINRNRKNVILKVMATDVHILWNGYHRAVVCFPNSFQGSVTGVCGNFDLDPENDLMLSPLETATDDEVGYMEFGERWNTDTSCQAKIHPPNQCTELQAKEAEQPNRCGMLLEQSTGPFSYCHGYLDMQEFYNSCARDLCSALSDEKITRQIVCEHMHNAHEYCSVHVFVGTWWFLAGCDDDNFVQVDMSGYSDWGPWGECSVECATVGHETRTRFCEEKPCEEEAIDYKPCNKGDLTCQTSEDCANMVQHDDFSWVGFVHVKVVGQSLCRGVHVTNTMVLTVSKCVYAGIPSSSVTVIDANGTARVVKDVIPSDGVTMLSLYSGPFRTGPGNGEPPPINKTSHFPHMAFGDYRKLQGMCMFPSQTQSIYLRLVDHELCGMHVDDVHYFCLETTLPVYDDSVVGEAVLVLNDQFILVGLVAEKHTSYAYKVLNLAHYITSVGCHEALSGYWTKYYNNDNPIDGTDLEHWATMDELVCGFGFPVCIEYEIDVPAVDFFKYVSNNCPSEQRVGRRIANGFMCDSSEQNAECHCHDYKVRFKCTYRV